MATPKFVLSITLSDLRGLNIELLWRNFWYTWHWRRPFKVSRDRDQWTTEDFR